MTGPCHTCVKSQGERRPSTSLQGTRRIRRLTPWKQARSHRLDCTLGDEWLFTCGFLWKMELEWNNLSSVLSRSTVTPIFPPPLSPWCRQRHAVAEPLINRSVYPKKNINDRKIVKKGKQKQEKNSVSRGGTGKREKGRSVGKRPVRGACCMHQGPMKGACL